MGLSQVSNLAEIPENQSDQSNQILDSNDDEHKNKMSAHNKSQHMDETLPLPS